MQQNGYGTTGEAGFGGVGAAGKDDRNPGTKHNAGKLRAEVKDYVVRDGDVMNFRFNV